MVTLMIGTGLFLIRTTKGVIFTRLNIVMRYTARTLFQKSNDAKTEEGTITPFQAVCTALAATVGTGNIVGVALAIATGGPGAIFWLWVSGMIGMVIKYCEVTLSQAYRTDNARGETVGGPMYYIENGMGMKWLAVLFAVFASFASLGIGASVQSNALAGGLQDAFGWNVHLVGVLTATLTALIIIGGIRRIAGLAEFLVPFMSVLYVGGALTVLAVNVSRIPAAMVRIFRDAFSGSAAIGGFSGASAMYACRIGMARGVFTHEAGMGSAPIAHASADNDHPARQGLWGAFEVFFDSLIMCTITALVILTSGLWQDPFYTGDGRGMSAAAFEDAFSLGGCLVAMGLCLFAFATIVAWYYYGEKCIGYLTGDSWIIKLGYQTVYTVMVYVGCIASLDAVWEVADLFNGLMAIPNLIALIALSGGIRRLTEDFFQDPDSRRLRNADFTHLIIVRK